VWAWTGNRNALGSGADNQRYLAYNVDGFLDYPLDADNEILAQGAIIRYDHYAG